MVAVLKRPVHDRRCIMRKSSWYLVGWVGTIGVLVACGGENQAPAGLETGPCVDAKCLDGLVCLSELCVSLDEPTNSGAGTDGPGDGTVGDSATSTTNTTSTTGTAGDVMEGDSTDPDSATAGGECNHPTPSSGQSCDDDAECQDGVCFHVGVLGGYCGECTSDADCPCGGCTHPSALLDPPGGAVCNTGELGDGCQSTAVCQVSLTCEVVLDIPGVVTASSCSECGSDAACPGGQLCSVSIDLGALAGQRHCVAPGSQPLGSTCDHTGSGDQACASGMCVPANIMGLAEVGVCSECAHDGQCPGVCAEPDYGLDTNTFTPGACAD